MKYLDYDVFKKIKKNMLNEKNVSEIEWNKYGEDWFNLENKTPLAELQVEIYRQRLQNIKDYLDNCVMKPEKPDEKILLSDDDKKILLRYYFFCNNLKEMNFIGTDFFLRTRFVKQQVDYLYSALDEIEVSKKSEDANKEVPVSLHADNIALKTYYQIAGDMARVDNETTKEFKKEGYDVASKMYSYSKSLLLAMYKYLTLREEKNKVASIEIREKAWVNCVSKDENEVNKSSLQEYLWDIEVGKLEGNKPLPYFCIDMSNTGYNYTTQIFAWWKDFDSKLDVHQVSSVKDIEVLTNFTGENNILAEGTVKRLDYTEEQIVELLFWSFCMYVYKKSEKTLNKFVQNLQYVLKKIKINSAEYVQKKFIEKIKGSWKLWDKLDKYWDEPENNKINLAEYLGITEKLKLMAEDQNKDWGEQEFLKEIFSCINWENEIEYLKRGQESMKQYNDSFVMKESIGKWKYILYHTVENAFTNNDKTEEIYSNLRWW